jgi:hypothetical protein
MSDTDKKIFAIKETELKDILQILSGLPYKDVHLPMLILEQLPVISEGCNLTPHGESMELIMESP